MDLIRMRKADGDVHILEMNTGKANALNAPLLEALNTTMDRTLQSGARAVILTGYDQFFSAGLDLVTLSKMDRDPLRQFILTFSETLIRIFRFPRPLVAAINGHAIAGGCIIALAADVRLMSRGEYKIGLAEIDLGIPLPSVAMELARSALPAGSLVNVLCMGTLFNPDAARELGLVDEVLSPDHLLESATNTAQKLASKPSAAFEQIKQELRSPTIQRIEARAHQQLEIFLDLWFSKETQTRIQNLVASLTNRGN